MCNENKFNWFSKTISYLIVGSFILLHLVVSVASANDQGIVLGVGKAVAGLEPDGTWRQPTFQQDSNTRDTAWLLGWEAMVSPHWGYRVAYHSWGRQTLAAGFLSGGDFRYVESTPNHCDEHCPATNWAFSYFEAKGLEVSGKAQTTVWKLTTYGRIGIVAYQAEQTTDVPDQGEADNPDSYRRQFGVYHMVSHGLSGMGAIGIGGKTLSLEYLWIPGVRAKDSAFRGIKELVLVGRIPF